MKAAVLRVQGMTCASCEHHVARALERVGARDVHADWAAGQARFALPGGVEDEALSAAVEAAGYDPGELHTVPSTGTASPSTVPGDRPIDYDLVVVAAGSAAFAAAIRARNVAPTPPDATTLSTRGIG